jgi:pseudaminic acid cytidylyltransferase
MPNIAIIPARGGSRRIPRKNIKDFFGKPIIVYSIEIALQSELFDEVMVSTDDNEIADIAIQNGAKVPFFRSTEASSDYATTIDVLKDVLTSYKNEVNKEFDLICCIYPTAPLIQIQHIKSGLELLTTNNYYTVFPVVAFSYPVWRGFAISNDGKTKLIWPEYRDARSQDLMRVYHDAGQWYWLKASKINNSVFTENSGTIVLNEEIVQDIDNLTDWKLAEIKYRLLHEA